MGTSSSKPYNSLAFERRFRRIGWSFEEQNQALREDIKNDEYHKNQQEMLDAWRKSQHIPHELIMFWEKTRIEYGKRRS